MHSPAHAADGRFHNHEPGVTIRLGAAAALLRGLLSGRDTGRPHHPVPLATGVDPPRAAAPLAVTWFGHSSASGRAACIRSRCH